MSRFCGGASTVTFFQTVCMQVELAVDYESLWFIAGLIGEGERNANYSKWRNMFGEYYARPYWFAGVGGWPTFRPSVSKGFVDVAAEAGGEGDEFFGMRGQEVLVDAGFVVEAVPV